MKLSRKGYQQRMFFLFSDMLVYTTRMATPALQFKVHGQLPLKGMEVSAALILECSVELCSISVARAVINSHRMLNAEKC